MPKKIRELIRELKMAGFIDRGGKGSHRSFMHPSGVALTVSGQLGDDAKPYQIKSVREKIEESQK
jgi:predicted RNA binding protein YcfA (HicA-like mRNA interferase family)